MDSPHRKPIRLQQYDYSQNGMYFITICAHNRQPLFGEICADKRVLTDSESNPCRDEHCSSDCAPTMELSRIGILVDHSINDIHNMYTHIDVDAYCIMPDHIHMIIVITNHIPQGGRTMFVPTENVSISRVIKQFKGFITKQLGFSPWQARFNDHIIRDDKELNEIRRYIETNVKTYQPHIVHSTLQIIN